MLHIHLPDLINYWRLGHRPLLTNININTNTNINWQLFWNYIRIKTNSTVCTYVRALLYQIYWFYSGHMCLKCLDSLSGKRDSILKSNFVDGHQGVDLWRQTRILEVDCSGVWRLSTAVLINRFRCPHTSRKFPVEGGTRPSESKFGFLFSSRKPSIVSFKQWYFKRTHQALPTETSKPQVISAHWGAHNHWERKREKVGTF